MLPATNDTSYNLIYSNALKASPEHLKAYAQEAGLDLAPFAQCLATGKYQAAVQRDIDAGTRLGVTGTPAFFINGRLLSGAQPLERFVQLIEEELQRTR